MADEVFSGQRGLRSLYRTLYEASCSATLIVVFLPPTNSSGVLLTAEFRPVTLGYLFSRGILATLVCGLRRRQAKAWTLNFLIFTPRPSFFSEAPGSNPAWHSFTLCSATETQTKVRATPRRKLTRPATIPPL